MRTLSIVNIEKFNKGYLERNNPFFKVSASGIRDFKFMKLCEVDRWRFIKFLDLQIAQKKPIVLDNKWLRLHGFNFKNRSLGLTLIALENADLIEIEGTVDTPVDTTVDTTVSTTVSTTVGTTVKKQVVDSKGDTNSPLYRKERKEKRKERRPDLVRVFDFWNSKNLIKHRDLKKFESSINTILENYSYDEVTNAIQNYDEISASPDYWFNWRGWTLYEFLTRKTAFEKFLSLNQPWNNFENTNSPAKKKYISQSDLNAAGQKNEDGSPKVCL